MKVLVTLSCLLALGAAQLGYPYSVYNPYFYAGGYNYNAPLTYSAAPAPVTYSAVPAASVSSQYHAQDELGQFNYGYADGLSSKNEYRRFDGATVGSYSYLDANGKVQTVSYTADDVNGFRVTATNLPVAPKDELKAPEFNLESPVFDGQAPEPVQDTPEVAAAKAEFAKLYADAAAAAEAAPDTDAAEPAEESARRRRSAVLLPALAKATVKTASFDKVEADTPADTTLVELKEKEHETYVPTTYAAPAFHYSPAVTYAVPTIKKVEVKHVAAPAITYTAPITYTSPVVHEVKVKKVETPVTYAATPLTYGFHPYGLGAPFVYSVAAEAEKEAAEKPAVESAERRKRSAVLLPAVAKATVKTVSLDKVEADTPADTTLLELKEKEHETYVPATYAAPAFHYSPAVTYTVPTIKKVEVKHVAAPAITYTAPITYTSPVVHEVKVKKVETPVTYSALAYPYAYGLGTPLVYKVAAPTAEAEEKAE
ncbi:uncharacterized protein LOC122378665 [Amphibalanus amphitrite]|uniref:uncharacterized protein LOC122378665 n=1 Tax=Amphibalanus amphitrite TaxID=1232801 RepID=UPI001C915994|nr:uncharacterized protein LOC122378665 [Amphibalanus amphitrite]